LLAGRSGRRNSHLPEAAEIKLLESLCEKAKKRASCHSSIGKKGSRKIKRA
jgi:hypothetical protein